MKNNTAPGAIPNRDQAVANCNVAEAAPKRTRCTWSPLASPDTSRAAVVKRQGTRRTGEQPATLTGHTSTGPGEVASVRQNLSLLIDHDQIASTVDCGICWGSTLDGVVDPARSGRGVTAHGRLIGVGGEHLTVSALAAALLGAGAMRAVELDINPAWVAGCVTDTVAERDRSPRYPWCLGRSESRVTRERYSQQALTVINNHRARMLMSGVADMETLRYFSELVGDEEVKDRSERDAPIRRRPLAPADELRQIKPEHALLIYGALRPTMLKLRLYFKDRKLRELAGGEHTQAA